MKNVSAKPASAGLFLLFILGTLTAFDAMSIDMYLPAFTAIQGFLNTTAGSLEISLSLFIAGLAIGQAVYGPVVDSFGKKKPLIAGIVLFAAASLLLASSSNIYLFLAGRFIQGLGGAAGLVIPRAIVADYYDSESSAKIYAVLMQISSVAPVIAPPLGGLLLKAFGWQSIFYMIGIFGLLILIASLYAVPSEKKPEASEKKSFSFKNMIVSYKNLVLNRKYMKNTLSLGFIYGTLFAYISGSSYMFVQYFGMSAINFSILFMVNSTGLLAAGIGAILMMRVMKNSTVVTIGMIVHLTAVAALISTTVLGLASLAATAVIIFVCISSLSLLFGGLTSEVMFSADSSQTGSASALLGVTQYLIGACSSFIIGFFHDGSLVPMALTMTICSSLAAACWWTKVRAVSEIRTEMPEISAPVTEAEAS